MDMEVAGLPLKGDDDMEHPLAVVMVVKGLDAEGVVGYYIKATEGLTSVEGMGMSLYLTEKLRLSLGLLGDGG